jgi:hypothetical protein
MQETPDFKKAIKIVEEMYKHAKNRHLIVTMARDYHSDPTFNTFVICLKRAAEHLSTAIDAKGKEAQELKLTNPRFIKESDPKNNNRF